MKKCLKLFLATILSSIFLAGCMSPIMNYGEKTFHVDDYGIDVTTSRAWTKNRGNNFDLQLFNGSHYFSVMAYNSIDLAEGETPVSIFEWHNDDLMSKRENPDLIEGPIIYQSNDKWLIRKLYSAENEGMKNYYLSVLVTFDETEDVFAWVLVTGVPSEITANMDELLEIVESMKLSEK